MESYDPSARRLQRELSSVPGQNFSSPMSLSRFVKLMSEMGIDGPHEQREVHMCGSHLGSGAQFDVYGHQHVADTSVPAFDQPFVSTKSPSGATMRPVIVAIKRPRFTLAVGNYHPEASSLNVGFGTPSQLYALELEVLALCHESIRNHRNIVKLLAWGFELARNIDRDRGVDPLSPLLVLEHGNCSLRQLYDKGPIPRQVLQRLALDVTRGLSVLHASKIIHGDLKTDNVLVFPDEEGPFFCIAKLSDFGLSVFDQNEKIFDIGTTGWKAPELPSDNGIDPEMLAKCDCFSLGLLIFSTILTNGTPPLEDSTVSKHAFEFAKRRISESKLPPQTSSRILRVLELLLQPNPSERISDLGNVCHLLEQPDKEPFDSHGSWINGRFDDNTPWGSLFLSNEGYTMHLGAFTKYKYWDQGLGKEDAVSIYAWLEIHKFLRELRDNEFDLLSGHYINGIDRIVSGRTAVENLSMEIVGQEITGHQLLGLCFTDRVKLDGKPSAPRVARRLRGSCAAVAATKGYFPAQAVALQLLEGTSSKLLDMVRSKYSEWQLNAVSTGYVLAWKFSHEHPKEYALALEKFRKSGGYNTHYIYTENKEHLSYDNPGTLNNPLGWLSAYPLHHAAALGDVSKIERLLKNHDINSFDASGETPLQRACMAGAGSSVRFLIQNGADPTLKSKSLGTVPLHWLFAFKPEEVSDIATLLTTKDKSVLDESSALEAEAFHFPFKWPVGTPLEWAVLSNRTEAVTVLLQLGTTLDSIMEFFPGPPNWTKNLYSSRAQGWDLGGVDDPTQKLWRVWIYYSMTQFQLPIVQENPKYQKQLDLLASNSTQRAERWGLHIPRKYVGGLNKAVAENNFDAVKQLITNGVDVNYVAKKQSGLPTALDTAIEQRNPDIVQLLLDNGATFSGEYPYETRPLLHAVSTQHMGIVKMLLDKGAEVNALSGKTDSLRSALYEAARSSSTSISKLLLQYGADPSMQSPDEMNPLEAAVNSNSLEIVEIFLEKGANPNTTGRYPPYCQNALQGAAYFGNTKILRTLLDKGADPNIQGGNFGTALQAATNPNLVVSPTDRKNAVQLLLERGANATINGGNYGSVMQAAACANDEVVAKILLDAGAPVGVGGGPHGSALQAAVWTGNLILVQLLLNHEADPDFGGEDKWKTPLQVAVHREDEKQVELLLKRGADPNIPGGLDGTALKTAEKSGNARIIRMLLDWGAQDKSELDRWNSTLNRISTPPLSRQDTSSAQTLLARCFERSTQVSLGTLAPIDLANKIIDFAGYWLADLSQRYDGVEVSEDTQSLPYLQVTIKDWPDTGVRQMVFRTKTRDTAVPKMPELHRDNPYQNIYTWFEAGVRSINATDPHKSRITIHKSFRASLTTRTHNITWDLNGNDIQVSRFLSSLKPGDVVDVYAKAKIGISSYVNYVDSMEAVVFYSHTKVPISQSLITEAPRKESEPTPINTESSPLEAPETPRREPESIPINTEPPLPVVLETPVKPPSQMKTETIADGTSSPKGSATTPQKGGVFSRFINFLTRCLK